MPDAIHIAQNGQKLGPFSKDQIEGMLRSGMLNYETLAWVEGQPDWKPLRDVIPCTVPPPPPIATTAALPPQIVTRRVHPVLSYFLPVGRIGRANWFLRNVLNLFALGILGTILSLGQPEMSDGVSMLIGFAFIYMVVVNSSKRFHDLNVTAWASPLVFVPLVPLFLLVLGGTNGTNRYGEAPPDFGTGY